MFGRKKKSPGILYQIVGSSGISDGDTVQPKERITKSFTILNKAPLNSKEKGRVVKVTQSHGESMKSQVLFLWPVPGKFVTFSLDLVAPETPGDYESYWIMEGAEEPEFWVKFKVSDINSNSITFNDNIREDDREDSVQEDINDDEKPKRKRRKTINSSIGAVTKRKRSHSRKDKVKELTKGIIRSNSMDIKLNPDNPQKKSFRGDECDRRVSTGSIKDGDSEVNIREGKKSKKTLKDRRSLDLKETSDLSSYSDASEFSEEIVTPTRRKRRSTVSGKEHSRRRSSIRRKESPLAQTYSKKVNQVSDSKIDEKQESLDDFDNNSNPVPKPISLSEPIIIGKDINIEEITIVNNIQKDEIDDKESNEVKLNNEEDKIFSIDTDNSNEDLILTEHQNNLLEELQKDDILGKDFDADLSALHSLDKEFDQNFKPDHPKLERGNSRLLNRWQESVISNASRELTEKQQERQKKLKEVSMSMKDVRKRCAQNLPGVTVNTEKEIESTDCLLSSPRRLLEFNQAKSEKELLLKTERTIQSYIDLGNRLTEQALQLFTLFPSNDTLLTKVSSCQQAIISVNAIVADLKEGISSPINELNINANIGGLSDNIWIKIFSYLPLSSIASVSIVCREWNVLTKQDNLWKFHTQQREKLCDFASNFTNKRLSKIEKQFGNWFEDSLRWKTTGSTITEQVSFNWPVYDLEIIDNTLVTVSDCLRVFDISKKKSFVSLAGHHKVVNCVRMMQNSKACITGSADCTVKIWSLRKKTCMQSLEGHSKPIVDVHHSLDTIISCGQDKVVKLWKKITGDCLFTKEYSDEIGCLAMNLTEPSNHVFFGHHSGKVTTFDLETQQEVQSIQISDKEIEGLQVFGKQFIVSDYSQIYVNNFQSKSPLCVSPVMSKNVGRIQYDGYKLGAQVGNRIQIFDLRNLFTKYSQLTVDNLWKGAFQFHEDYILVGGGNGETNKWYPSFS